MNHPIILDACTLINLLRIDDEDDEFMYKRIVSLNLYLAECVHDEIKRNFDRNDISGNKKKYIERCINNLFMDLSQKKRLYKDHDIINDITRSTFDELKNYSIYKKRENGELLSSALCLIASRLESDKVYFCTDDYRAVNQLIHYYTFQQSGFFLDSVDLLLLLYWSSSKFDKRMLLRCLNALWSDICQPLRKMITEIEVIRQKFSSAELRNRQLIKHVDCIIDGYYQSNMDMISESVDYILYNSKHQALKNVTKKYYSNIIVSPLMLKIKQTRNDLNKYEIFKLA